MVYWLPSGVVTSHFTVAAGLVQVAPPVSATVAGRPVGVLPLVGVAFSVALTHGVFGLTTKVCEVDASGPSFAPSRAVLLRTSTVSVNCWFGVAFAGTVQP